MCYAIYLYVYVDITYLHCCYSPVLNKRLDMLRELLDVLQQQMENSHAVKLEWIIIYLIVAEVALQMLKILGY